MCSLEVSRIYRIFEPVFLTGLVAALFLTGCGDDSTSGDSSTSAVTTQTIEGFVEDGPIAGASVELCYYDESQGDYVTAYFCGSSGNGRCSLPQTKADGHFSFQVNAFANLHELVVVATGGVDQETGVSFEGLSMRSALRLFPERESAVVVTPFTTLMTGEIEQGATPDEAQQRIRAWLLLPPDQDLAVRPSAFPQTLQPLASVLTQLARDKMQNESSDPFCDLKTDSEEALLTENGGVTQATLEKIGEEFLAEEPHLSQEQKDCFIQTYAENFQDMSEALQATDLDAYKRLALKQSLNKAFFEIYEYPTEFCEEHSHYGHNLGLMTQDIQTAADSETIGSGTPRRLARYVALTYQIEYKTFLEDSASFENHLSRMTDSGDSTLLEDDPAIKTLASIGENYSVKVPITLPQIKTDLEKEAAESGYFYPEGFLDDPKNLLSAYYYRSDLSPFHEAEKLISSVNDADVNDAIMLKIVKAKAEAGLQAEVVKLLEGNAIVQSEYRAHAWRALGDVLRAFGQTEEALAALTKAEVLYRWVIEAKGADNLKGEDAENLQYLSRSFSAANDLTSSREVTDYLLGMAAHLETTSEYGKVVITLRDLAEQYLAGGKLTEARELTAALHELALNTPADDSLGFRYLRNYVFNLIQTATLYADLGDGAKVAEIHAHIEEVRSNDGLENLTRNETWAFMDDMVRNLYVAGYPQKALALAESIPESYINYLGKTMSGKNYRSWAYKEVATFIALEEGFEAGLAFITENFPETRDKIEVLTYYALNKKRSFIAQRLIDRDQLAEARAALDHARALLDMHQETFEVNVYLYIVNYGYAKLADLYHHAGAPQQASELFALALEIAEGMEDPRWQAQAMQSVADAFKEMGDLDGAKEVGKRILTLLGQTQDFSKEKYRMSSYRQALEIFTSLPDEALWQKFLQRTRDLFSEGAVYADTDHDDLAELEAEYLIRAANFLADLARASQPITAAVYRGEALALLDEAHMVIDQIYVDETRYNLYFPDNEIDVDLVRGYARAGDFAAGRAVAESIPYREKRHQALQGLAATYCAQDAFLDTVAARVDTDGDGAPDFFSPLATVEEIAASGLIEDGDSDGDGLPDLEDNRPLFADTFRRN